MSTRVIEMTIAGQTYEVWLVPCNRQDERDNGFGLHPRVAGKCDDPNQNAPWWHPPHRRVPRIRIREDLEPMEMMRVALHEPIHAAHWHLDEQRVDAISTVQRDVLWALGYRRVRP